MLELTVTVRNNNKEVILTTKQLFRLMNTPDDIVGEIKMLQLLRRYLRLMRTHDFSYYYTDDMNLWKRENSKRIQIMMLKSVLMLTMKGCWFIMKAEKKYGHV